MTDEGPFFTRVKLRQDAPAQTLVNLLTKGVRRVTGGDPATTGHHLVWLLFSDQPDRRRDFLWREISPGVFFVLSAREPVDRHSIFEVAAPKHFVPELRSGDILSFSLRANPVLRRRTEGGDLKKHDVVMDRLREIPPEERAGQRPPVTRAAGLSWLNEQSSRSGFDLDGMPVAIDGYNQVRVSRPGQTRPMTFSVLDFNGRLIVNDPGRLVDSIVTGFGSARAFGCGLMLIRRDRR